MDINVVFKKTAFNRVIPECVVKQCSITLRCIPTFLCCVYSFTCCLLCWLFKWSFPNVLLPPSRLYTFCLGLFDCLLCSNSSILICGRSSVWDSKHTVSQKKKDTILFPYIHQKFFH